MKNVLIPTDFTLNSLAHVSAAVKAIRGKCSIILFHAFDMPESLIDAMHRSGIKGHSNLITEELRLRCRKIKFENPSIADISFKIMYGTTIMAFRNYAEGNDIDFIYLPEGYTYKAVVRDSVDPTKWFKKSGIKIVQVQPAPETQVAQPRENTQHADAENNEVPQYA